MLAAVAGRRRNGGALLQPLILAEQTRQGVADFLATTFPATTPGFENLMARFLAEPGTLANGPYVTIELLGEIIGGKEVR